MKKLYILLSLLLFLVSSYGRNPSVLPQKLTFGDIRKQGRLWGIDLSHYQQVTDWELLKKQKPDFVFIKATEGTTIRDQKYRSYYKEFRKIKIPVGTYHFFSYKSSGRDQARNFLKTLIYQKGDLPPVLDVEFARRMPEKKFVIREISIFIKAIKLRTGKLPIVYCDYDYYLCYLKNTAHEQCLLWIVDYIGRPNCDWTFWQSTDQFRLNGIKGKVDFNIFNGTTKQLDALRY